MLFRSNQGHSVQVDVELKAAEPPRYLYHGTASRFLPAIQAEGIRKMSRQYVHLSGDFETAMAVGKRHGIPVVITIDAAAMARDGRQQRGKKKEQEQDAAKNHRITA